GKEQRWHIRQQGQIAIGALATIRIGRAREDRALDEMAERCATLERQVQERLDAAQAPSIDALVERRHERESILTEVEHHRDALARFAPPTLQSEQTTLAQHRQAILTRRPELVRWLPNLEELDRLRREFDEGETRLHAELQQARQAAAVAGAALQK